MTVGGRSDPSTLGQPGQTVRLSRTRLELRNPTQQLVLHAHPDDLAWLAATCEAVSVEGGERDVPAALQRLQRAANE